MNSRMQADPLSRRKLLRAAARVAMAAAVERLGASPARAESKPASRSAGAGAKGPLLRALDEKIETAMARHNIPGVAVGLVHDGREYVRGYGITNVEHPSAVDGDTLFRIGSTTKTFTGTAVMRLVDQGKLHLDAQVRTYLPELKLADESVAATVTVRQLLNHSAGWLGDDYADYGRGADALAQYVAGMQHLPQFTEPGRVFAYNNAAVNLAGRVIEAVSGMSYETAMQKLVLDPLGLMRTGFFTDALVGYDIAASHTVENRVPVVESSTWSFPRSLHSTGGLISSAREQLRYARFHLGDGTAPDGSRLLSPQSLQAMRSDPGPAGTITMEIDGVCVTWWQRRTAEGVPVFQHGGSWGGQNSDFFFVPQRAFAMTVLTNSTTGPKLIADLGRSGWALGHFVGLNNPPAVPKTLAPAQLAPYEGRYTGLIIPPNGTPDKIESLVIEVRAANGGLRVTGELELSLAFYRDDCVLTTDPEGQIGRSDFVRGSDGSVAWFRDRGRIYARQA
jgi:CubicO group peptidase (beta-lactamase class C family)